MSARKQSGKEVFSGRTGVGKKLIHSIVVKVTIFMGHEKAKRRGRGRS